MAKTAVSVKTEAGLKQLDEFLSSRTYIGSEVSATAVDFQIFEVLNNAVNQKSHPHVFRWSQHMTRLRTAFPWKAWPAGTEPTLGAAPKGAAAAPAAAEAKKDAPKQEKKEKAKAAPAPKAKAAAAAPAAAAPAGGSVAPSGEEDEAAVKVQLLVGKVTKVWAHPDSDKLFCEEIDCGEGEVRQIGSGLRAFYKAEEFEGKMVIVVANLKPKKLAGFPSNGMVLCASNADHTKVIIVDPPAGAKPGDRVSLGNLAMEEATPPNTCEKKKLWTKAQPQFTTKGGVCMYKDQPFTIPGAGQVTAPVEDGWSLS